MNRCRVTVVFSIVLLLACIAYRCSAERRFAAENENTRFLYPYFEGEKLGILDGNGDVLVKPDYDAMYPGQTYPEEEKSSILARKDEAWTEFFVDDSRQLRERPLPFALGAKRVRYHGDGVYTAHINMEIESETIGLEDTKKIFVGEVSLAKYHLFGHFQNGKIAFRDTISRKFGVADRRGNVVIPAQYDVLNMPITPQGLIVVGIKRDKKYLQGYLDQNGTEVISPRYLQAGDFAFGYAAVYENVRSAHYIRSDGSVALDGTSYRSACAFSGTPENPLAWVSPMGEDQYGMINLRGETVVSPAYDQVTDFHSSVAFGDSKEAFDESGSYRVRHFIDTQGKILFRYKMYKVNDRTLNTEFHGPLAFITTDSSMGYVTRHGDFIWKTTTHEYPESLLRYYNEIVSF